MQGFVCELCPRRCGVRRELEQAGPGRCRMGALPVVARAAPHHWEEPCISGSRGSGAVFFSGCSLGCVFCQNSPISQRDEGAMVSIEGLRRIFADLAAQGVHNLNLVNPTHFALAVHEALAQPPGLPVVYNTGGYERVETLRMLDGQVQVYLPDLKYLRGDMAARYSDAADYPRTATAALQEMARQAGPARFDGEGMLIRGLMVRHLVLPGQIAQAKAVLRYIKDELPPGTLVSLMGQYLPCGRAAEYPEINRRLSRREYDQAVDCLYALGFEAGYVQDRASAQSAYIPDFHLQGVTPYILK